MSSTITYVAYVERVPGTEFRAHFPDFPEVHARSGTIEHVSARARQALHTYIASLLQADEQVPRPMTLDHIRADGRYRHGFLLQIDAEVPESRLYTRRLCREPSSPAEEKTRN